MSRHRRETQEQASARRERQRARYAAMSPDEKRAFASCKNARKRNMPQMVIEPSRHMATPLQPKVERESIDSFIARGGCIEQLPPPGHRTHEGGEPALRR